VSRPWLADATVRSDADLTFGLDARDGLPPRSLLTFAHSSDGRLRPERGKRWDAAERALIRELGWVDAFRAING
jgi:hypothetical protein